MNRREGYAPGAALGWQRLNAEYAQQFEVESPEWK
jgi:hypothetical protein